MPRRSEGLPVLVILQWIPFFPAGRRNRFDIIERPNSRIARPERKLPAGEVISPGDCERINWDLCYFSYSGDNLGVSQSKKMRVRDAHITQPARQDTRLRSPCIP